MLYLLPWSVFVPLVLESSRYRIFKNLWMVLNGCSEEFEVELKNLCTSVQHYKHKFKFQQSKFLCRRYPVGNWFL